MNSVLSVKDALHYNLSTGVNAAQPGMTPKKLASLHPLYARVAFVAGQEGKEFSEAEADIVFAADSQGDTFNKRIAMFMIILGGQSV